MPRAKTSFLNLLGLQQANPRAAVNWLFARYNLLREFNERYTAASQKYRSRQALLLLDESQLKDIGITREKATKEASRDFWD